MNKAKNIFSKIEKIRRNNNKNWMDLLRLSYKNDPKNTLKILNNILKKDSQLVSLAKKLNKK